MRNKKIILLLVLVIGLLIVGGVLSLKNRSFPKESVGEKAAVGEVLKKEGFVSYGEGVKISNELAEKISVDIVPQDGYLSGSFRNLTKEPYTIKVLGYWKDYKGTIIGPEILKVFVVYPHQEKADSFKFPENAYEFDRVEIELLDIESISVKSEYRPTEGDPGITILRQDTYFDSQNQSWTLKVAARNDSNKEISYGCMRLKNEEGILKGILNGPCFRNKKPGETWTMQVDFPFNTFEYIFYFYLKE